MSAEFDSQYCLKITINTFVYLECGIDKCESCKPDGTCKKCEEGFEPKDDDKVCKGEQLPDLSPPGWISFINIKACRNMMTSSNGNIFRATGLLLARYDVIVMTAEFLQTPFSDACCVMRIIMFIQISLNFISCGSNW